MRHMYHDCSDYDCYDGIDDHDYLADDLQYQEPERWLCNWCGSLDGQHAGICEHLQKLCPACFFKIISGTSISSCDEPECPVYQSLEAQT